MPKAARLTNVVFTVNNYTEGSVTRLKAVELFKYVVVGRETGEEGTPHLQGYAQCKRKTAASVINAAIREACGNAPHTERAKGDWRSNFEYCTKEGDWEEWGEATKKKGERTDIKEFLRAAETTDTLELAREYPREFAKYHRAAQITRGEATKRARMDRLKEAMAGAELREWQQRAIERLDAQDDRKVLWYVDEKGGHGKTFLAKWLMVNRGAFYVQGGAHKDIAHAYGLEDYVVFDFTRDKEEICSYSMIETIKNGIIFSPKYESGVKLKENGAKVIVFSNWEPDTSKLSADRWCKHNLPEETPFTIAAEAGKRSRAEMEAEAFFDEYMSQPRDSFEWAEYDRKRARLNGDFVFE